MTDAKYWKLVILFAIIIAMVPLSYAALEFNVNAPAEVEIGKWFNISVIISSDNDISNLSVYSYIYRDTNVISQGWTANRKDINLKAGEPANVTLEDMVKYNTEEGLYNLRVKLRYNDSVINQTFPIKVHSESRLFEENYLYFILVVVSIIGLGLVFISRRW
jgi:hypothetical protein